MLGAVVIVALAAANLTLWIVVQAEAMIASGIPLYGDWTGYHDAAWRAILGAPLYEPMQPAGPGSASVDGAARFAETPGAVPWLLPFAGQSMGTVLWIAINCWFFVSGIFAALWRDLGVKAAIPFAFALLGCLPFASAALSADVNLFLAGTFAWSWAVGRAEPRIGALAAIAGLFRLVPSVLVLWPTGRARWRSVGIAIVVVAVSTLISLLLVGPQAWLDYASVLINAPPSCTDGGVSIACALTPTTGAAGAKAVAVGIALLALAGALRVRNDRAAFVLFGVAMLAPTAGMDASSWLIAYVALVVLIGGALSRAEADPTVPIPAAAPI